MLYTDIVQIAATAVEIVFVVVVVTGVPFLLPFASHSSLCILVAAF